MVKSFTLSALAVTLGCLLCSAASAAVDPATTAQLGQRLTPIGAEAGASADGRIPAWTGGLPVDAGKVENGFYEDPYSADKPLFEITAKNFQQYRDNLTPGQIALLQRYPDTYRMPVYPTRRSAGVPKQVADAARHNALSTRLVEGGNGLQDFQLSVPFPIPANGLEVVWNHITRYRGGSLKRESETVAPQTNGAFVPSKMLETFTFRDQLQDYDPKEPSNVLFYYMSQVTAPIREAGNVLLVHETLDQVKEPRLAWMYNSGQRRVRRAPQVAYDGVGQSSDGLKTSDGLDMYNGSPDRYDWQLLGKKEIYIPYNSYRMASPKLALKDLVLPGHLNPAYTRYELHRVWEVVGTLKQGERHIYAKRHFFVDEDTWSIAEADHYDARGTLWRVGEAHSTYFYDHQVTFQTPEVLYDLQSGRYLAAGLVNESSQPYQFGFKASKADYSPEALRNKGIR